MTITYLKPRRSVRIGPDAAYPGYSKVTLPTGSLELIEDTTAVDFVVVHASVEEQHRSEYELTTHPIGAGQSINDHKVKMARELRLECIVSNTPIPGDPYPQNMLPDPNFVVDTVFKDDWDTLRNTGRFPEESQGTDFVTQTWDILKRYQAQDELVEVYTTLEIYRNMQIVEISPTRSAQIGNALSFSITLVEVKIAEEEQTLGVKILRKRPKKSKEAEKTLLESLLGVPAGTFKAYSEDLVGGLGKAVEFGANLAKDGFKTVFKAADDGGVDAK